MRMLHFAHPAVPLAITLALALAYVPTAAAQQADWERQWKGWVEAAEKEGEVNVIVGPGQSFRDGIVGFSKAFPKIKLNVTSQHIRDALPRVMREREAGIYSADVMMGAAGAGVFMEWIPKGVLAELKPSLIRPDAIDNGKWLCGFDWGWMDKGKKYIIGFTAVATPDVWVNREHVSEADLPKSGITFLQLMGPQFSGKISWQDPRVLGQGQNVSALILKAHGETFLKDFILKQKPIFSRDIRQQVEWVIRNRYPIAMGLDETVLAEFQKEGLGKQIQPIHFSEGNIVIPGWGVMAMFDKAPHPNAAKVFANWVLTKDAQEEYHRTVRQNSRRTDVQPFAQASIPPANACETGLDLQKEEYAALRGQSGKVAATAYEQVR